VSNHPDCGPLPLPLLKKYPLPNPVFCVCTLECLPPEPDADCCYTSSSFFRSITSQPPLPTYLSPSTLTRLQFLLLFRIGSDRLYFIISCACRKQTLEEEEEGWRMRRGRAKCFFHSLCRTVACDPLLLHSEALSIAPVF